VPVGLGFQVTVQSNNVEDVCSCSSRWRRSWDEQRHCDSSDSSGRGAVRCGGVSTYRQRF